MIADDLPGRATDMPASPDREAQRVEAVNLFNHVWSLLESHDRSVDGDFDMLHAAHASRWHWGRAGGPQEWAIGEWQCSRVYAELGRPEPALVHAGRCVQLCRDHGLHGFVVASAHEALARAYLIAGDTAAARAERDRAAGLAAAIEDREDRAVVEADLASLAL